MALYAASSARSVIVAGEDILTLTPPATRKVKLVEVSVSGMGTASAFGEIVVQRSVPGTGPTAATIEPLDSDAPAAGSTVADAWTTEPAPGDEILQIGVNENGGIYRWVARPGQEIVARGTGESISLHAIAGAGNYVAHIIWEEI